MSEDNTTYKDYREYVKKHALKHGITEDEAETHLIVKYYKLYLKERETDVDNARTF